MPAHRSSYHRHCHLLPSAQVALAGTHTATPGSSASLRDLNGPKSVTQISTTPTAARGCVRDTAIATHTPTHFFLWMEPTSLQPDKWTSSGSCSNHKVTWRGKKEITSTAFWPVLWTHFLAAQVPFVDAREEKASTHLILNCSAVHAMAWMFLQSSY